MFVICIVLNWNSAFQMPTVQRVLTEDIRKKFRVDEGFLLFLLAGCVCASLALAALILLLQMSSERQKKVRQKKIRRLRYENGDAVVEPPRVGASGYHLFLSHTWAQGQDQMRIIKGRLVEMMPLCSVFLE